MSTSSPARRPMLLNPLWLQGVILTLVIGFAILFYLAIRIYQDHAPVPGRIVAESGETFLTEEDILQGQEHFLTYGLMQYGTVYGHGAYLGPDFTADYLHRAALHMQELYGGGEAGRGPGAERAPGEPLRPGDGDPGLDRRARSPPSRRSIGTGWRTSTTGRPAARGAQGPHDRRRRTGRARSTAFIAWTAWTATARRPGKTYSYTNNWPPGRRWSATP